MIELSALYDTVYVFYVLHNKLASEIEMQFRTKYSSAIATNDVDDLNDDCFYVCDLLTASGERTADVFILLLVRKFVTCVKSTNEFSRRVLCETSVSFNIPIT